MIFYENTFLLLERLFWANNMPILPRSLIRWPPPEVMDDVEEQASKCVSAGLVDLMADGDEADQQHLIKTHGWAQLHHFLEEVFGGEYTSGFMDPED